MVINYFSIGLAMKNCLMVFLFFLSFCILSCNQSEANNIYQGQVNDLSSKTTKQLVDLLVVYEFGNFKYPDKERYVEYYEHNKIILNELRERNIDSLTDNEKMALEKDRRHVFTGAGGEIMEVRNLTDSVIGRNIDVAE